MPLASGHEAEDLKGEELERQQRDFQGYNNGLVRIQPGGWIFPSTYKKFADKNYNFKFRSSDVVVMTWPKCGTTWTQEIIWTMRNNPNLDHPMAGVPIMARSPFMDMDMILPAIGEKLALPLDNPILKAFSKMQPGKDPDDGIMIQMAESLPDPRTIKTHLPLSLLSPDLLDTSKIVYVARNPKDVVVSYHHHSRLIKAHGYVGTIEEFVQYFTDDELMYGPYWLHVKEAWEKRNHSNMYIMFYEDLKADPLGEIRKLDAFLGTNLSEGQMQNIVKYTSFSEMQKRDNTRDDADAEAFYRTDVLKNEGGFFRKGEAGNWKVKLTPELSEKIDKWIAEKMNFGVNFKYSISKSPYASGHIIEDLKGEELKRQMRDWQGYPEGLVRLHPGRWIFPDGYKRFADKNYNFQFRNSDVVVMTWPKCGTTWTQEIIWTMRNNANLDHPHAAQPIMGRSPFLDMDMLVPASSQEDFTAKNAMTEAFSMLCPGKNPADGVMIQMAGAIPDPRTIKTHLPLSLLTPTLLDTSKVVYVARNPKDVLVSYHHHCQLIRLHGYVGSFEEFVKYFIDDELVYGPYWLHVKEAWEKRNHPNMHIVFFEDLKADAIGEIRKLNTFIGTNLSEEQMNNIAKYTSFSEMKARGVGLGDDEFSFFNKEIVQKDGGFFRKGETGSWKAKLTPELEEKVNKWVKDKMNFGVNFKYSLSKSSYASEHIIEDLKGEELKRQMRDWKGYPEGLVRLHPGGWIFPDGYKRFADKDYNFEFRNSDVVVMTWPKCGTTWTQEIIWTMRNNANLDHPLAVLPIMARAPFMDMDMLLAASHKESFSNKNPLMEAFSMLCPGKDPADGVMLQIAGAIPDPRTIKTHLPLSLVTPTLLDTSKVVYVARNPKDVLVSYHHHCRMIKSHGYVGSFEEFVKYFTDDELVYGPYWLHVKEAWEKRNHPNMHIVFFEDLKADAIGEIRKLNTFIGTNLSEEQMNNIAKYTSFSEMKARGMGLGDEEFSFFNKEVVQKDGGFFRKGETGSWKAKLTPELEEKVNKWVKDKMNFGVSFKYSL